MAWSELFAAFTIGLLGAGHCFAMCGGISSALSFSVGTDDAVGDKQHPLRVDIICAYNLGRVISYALIGALVATFISATGVEPRSSWLRIVAGFLLVSMGLYLANIWRGLVWLERGGQFLWQFIAPFASRLMPVKTFSTAMVLGMLWGWLPCGLVYTGLAYAAAQADAFRGALVMLFFGFGTLPAVVTGGITVRFFKRIFFSVLARKVMALLLVLFGLWTWFGVYQHLQHGHSHHINSEPQNRMEHHHHH